MLGISGVNTGGWDGLRGEPVQDRERLTVTAAESSPGVQFRGSCLPVRAGLGCRMSGVLRTVRSMQQIVMVRFRAVASRLRKSLLPAA